jgi:hypothetical protein
VVYATPVSRMKTTTTTLITATMTKVVISTLGYTQPLPSAATCDFKDYDFKVTSYLQKCSGATAQISSIRHDFLVHRIGAAVLDYRI